MDWLGVATKLHISTKVSLLVLPDFCKKTVPNIITVTEECKFVNGKTVTVEIAEP